MKADVLWKALDVLREKGMAKGVLEMTPANARWGSGEIGSVCARGAMHYALQGNSLWASGYAEEAGHLADVANELFPPPPGWSDWDDIADFNNHPDTTQEMLEQVFEKAAIRADEVLSA